MEGSVSALWPEEYQPIQDAVAYFLLTESLAAVRCTSEQLITPLNSLGGADGREEVMLVDKEMIGRAFSKCGKEYTVLYEDMLIDQGGEAVMVCRIGKQFGSAREGNRRRVTDFGCFSSDIDAEIQERVLSRSDQPPPPHPLESNWGKIRRELNVPDEVKQALHDFLKKKMRDKKQRDNRKSKKKSKRMRSPAKDPKPKEKPPTEEAPSSPQATAPPEVSPNNKSPTKPAHQKKARVDLPSKQALEEKYKLLATQLKSVRGMLLEHQAVEEAEDTDNLAVEGRSAVQDETKAKRDTGNTLYYVRNAKAGKIEIGNHGIIHEDELLEGLVALPGNINDEEFDSTRRWTTYEAVATGYSSSWIPSTHDLKIRNRKAETEREHDIMLRLKKLFGGDISTWSYRPNGSWSRAVCSAMVAPTRRPS
jgi:hypothetical protein